VAQTQGILAHAMPNRAKYWGAITMTYWNMSPARCTAGGLHHSKWVAAIHWHCNQNCGNDKPTCTWAQ